MPLDVSRIWQRTVSCSSHWQSRKAHGFVDENKTQIAKSGALVPLTRLAKSKDMRVQRNATGALLNMTHSGQLFETYLRLRN